MSNNAPNWYTEEWSTMVNHYYQAAGFEMKGLMTPPVQITGNKMYWPYVGEFDAYEAQRNAVSLNSNVAQDLIEQTWAHYEVNHRELQIDLDKTIIQTRNAKQRGMAMALGRKHTSMAIAQMVADAKAASQNYGAYNAAWSLTAAANALAALFDQVESDQEGAICVLPYAQFQQMMTEPEFSNSDFVGPDLPFIRKGMSKTWNGCHWYGMPKRKGKTDPVFPLANTTELDFPIWVPSAFGHGAGFNNIRTYIDWNGQIQGGAWDHKAVAGWGFKTLQVKGIVNCRVQETSSISFA